MNLLDYTSYEDVRAALGVAEEELENETLALPLYADALEVDLEEIHIKLPAAYRQASLAVEDGSATLNQDRFVKAARLFACYSVAKQATVSLRLFSPEQVTDGKSMIRRAPADQPYQKTIDAILREYSRFRARLIALFDLVNDAQTTGVAKRTLFVVSAPVPDPVTGT